MRSLALLLAVCLALPATTSAQDKGKPGAAPQAQPTPAAVEVPAAAQADVCLPLEAHQMILADLRELRGTDGLGGLRLRVRLLDEQVSLHIAQVRDLTLSRDLAVQSRDAAVKVLEEAVRGKRAAEEARDAWHRSPVLWLATGVVGALVIAVIADKLQR